jgi:hypothetical protein
VDLRGIEPLTSCLPRIYGSSSNALLTGLRGQKC